MLTRYCPLWFVDFIDEDGKYETANPITKCLAYYREDDIYDEKARIIIIDSERFGFTLEDKKNKIIYKSQLLCPTSPQKCPDYVSTKFYIVTEELESFYGGLQIYSDPPFKQENLLYFSKYEIDAITFYVTIVALVPFKLIYRSATRDIIVASKVCRYNAKENIKWEEKTKKKGSKK